MMRAGGNQAMVQLSAAPGGARVVQLAGDGTPKGNQAQNKQFRGAMAEIARKIGRKLTKDEQRQLHDAISGQDYGYHEIVEEGVAMFGGR